jgi:hypothetical protein
VVLRVALRYLEDDCSSINISNIDDNDDGDDDDSLAGLK